jgi:hypothetical protein
MTANTVGPAVKPRKGPMAKRKSAEPSRGELVHCPICDSAYERSLLVRKTESFPGIKRPGGGPNGARKNYFVCCPNGHKVLWLGFRVS